MFWIIKKFFEILSNAKINQTSSANVYSVGSELNNVELQILDVTYNWRTCHVRQNNSQLIVAGMKQLAQQFPGHRVRVIDSNGNLVNIM